MVRGNKNYILTYIHILYKKAWWMKKTQAIKYIQLGWDFVR